MSFVPQPLDRSEYERRFCNSQQLIVAAAEDRLQCLQQLTICIDDCLQAVNYAKQRQPEVKLRDTDELSKCKERLADQLTLSVIVFGRSKTGKSTLLNQLIRLWPDQQVRGHLFPSAGQICSARIAKVCHGETAMASVLDNLTGVTEEEKYFDLTCTQTIRPFMELIGDDRQDIEKLRKLVVIQVPHPLLQPSLQLVDSPGMGEDQNMNKVVQDFLNSLCSGIIVYVVDGKEGYKPDPDKENIKFLMEQHSLQKLIVVNRVDFDFETWLVDNDHPYDLTTDSMDYILEGLQEDIGFDFTEKCISHTQGQIQAVGKAFKKNHRDCLSGTGLIGVSAKSVKQLIAGDPVLIHAPYVDSFLQLEAHLAALVYENGRQHVVAAARIAQSYLAEAKSLTIDFYSGLTEKSGQVMQLLRSSMDTIQAIFNHIRNLLDSMVECDALDLSNPGSELNRLKVKFAREEVTPEHAVTEPSLMMRNSEAQLIQSLVKASGGSRQARAAIRLLCNFKDMVVTRLRTILLWNYKMIFMVEANRPLSKLDAKCKGLLDSLEQHTAQVPQGQSLENVIRMARIQLFTPDPDGFSQLCVTSLAESLRVALSGMTKRDDFRRLMDALSPQFSQSVEEREQVLTYFMETVDLTQHISEIIVTYRDQLSEKKVLAGSLLAMLLQQLVEKQDKTAEQIADIKRHNERISTMDFYIHAMVTRANWTADYDTDHRQFQAQCREMEVAVQSIRRLKQLLKPRFASLGDVGGGGDLKRRRQMTREPLHLHYRILRLPQVEARCLIVDLEQVRSRLSSPVTLHWLCLADTYRDFLEAPRLELVISFEGDYVSLADLQPDEISDADRVAWFTSLIGFCAKLLGAVRHYRPSDYRPSCVMLRRLGLLGAENGDEEVAPDNNNVTGSGLSGEAFPDPTRLIADPDQTPSPLSLAACAVVLFTSQEAFSRDDAAAPHDQGVNKWDTLYELELRRLAAEDRDHYMATLNRRLEIRGRSRDLLAAVSRCVRACLTVADAVVEGTADAAAAVAIEVTATAGPLQQMEEARTSLLDAATLSQLT